MNQINLSIANFNIQLNSELSIQLEIGYAKFIVSDVEEPDIVVECRQIGAEDVLCEAEKVFSSSNDEQQFYDVYKKDDDFLFAIYDQQSRTDIQHFARLNNSLKNWIIWSKVKNGAIDPLQYPMGPVLLHYAVLSTDAVMMHASGVFDGEKGRMFSGFSGVGKSTISKIWEKEGNLLINDDRLIIRKEEDGYFIYNTPMFYEDKPKRAPLDAVYLIYHSPENTIEKLTGAVAVTGIMAFSIQNNYDQQFVLHHLDFFTEMCNEVPVYRLGFVPDKQVVEFVIEHG